MTFRVWSVRELESKLWSSLTLHTLKVIINDLLWSTGSNLWPKMCDHDHEWNGQSYLNILVQLMSPFSLHSIILVWWLAGVNSNFQNSNLSFFFGFHRGKMWRIWNLECWYLGIEELLKLLLEFFKCFSL